MPKKPNAPKEAKRRTVAKALIAGTTTKATARAAGCTVRQVQRLAKEPETQFLITEALKPHQAKLQRMAARAVQVVQQGFSAVRYVKAGKDDYRLRGDALARLKAVERYGDLLNLAQGRVAEVERTTTLQMTWEEFQAMYEAREREEGT